MCLAAKRLSLLSGTVSLSLCLVALSLCGWSGMSLCHVEFQSGAFQEEEARALVVLPPRGGGDSLPLLIYWWKPSHMAIPAREAGKWCCRAARPSPWPRFAYFG
jgi:hypothetical protein